MKGRLVFGVSRLSFWTMWLPRAGEVSFCGLGQSRCRKTPSVCPVQLSWDGFSPDFSLICPSTCKTSKNVSIPVPPLPQQLREVHSP